MRNKLSLRNESGEAATLVVVLLVIALCLWGGYKLIGVAADYMAQKIPDDVETDLFKNFSKRHPEWQQEAKTSDQKRALAIFEKLKKAKGLRKLPFTLVFMPEDDPNAFAIPGGTIAITDGLLKMVRTEIGLATVIGHEFGHHQHRDAMKAMGRSILLAGALIIVGGDHGYLLNSVLGLAESSNSRADEFAADAYGIKLVHRLYHRTNGADEFFIKLEMDPDTKDSQLTTFMSSHPYTPDRIKRLRQLMEKLDAAH